MGHWEIFLTHIFIQIIFKNVSEIQMGRIILLCICILTISISKMLTSDHSDSVAAAADDPEVKNSGEQCILVVPEAEDLDEVPLHEAVSLLELAAKLMV